MLPCALEILAELRALGIKLALCSNDSQYGIQIAERRGLLNAFDYVIFSWEAHKRKRTGEMFGLCINALGRFPEECVLVDDGGDESLLAAKEYSPELKTLRVEHPQTAQDPRRTDMQADLVVPDLFAVPQAIVSLLG